MLRENFKPCYIKKNHKRIDLHLGADGIGREKACGGEREGENRESKGKGKTEKRKREDMGKVEWG